VAYCNSAETLYDLAEDEDFNSEMEMSDLMDADIGVRAGVFDKYGHGYATESHMGESSSSFIHAPISLHDFDEGKHTKPFKVTLIFLFHFDGIVELF
jgi:anaphase-promoting complex subunit 5